jgi:hypothetical protein
MADDWGTGGGVCVGSGPVRGCVEKMRGAVPFQRREAAEKVSGPAKHHVAATRHNATEIVNAYRNRRAMMRRRPRAPRAR